jgi:RNA polymerase sigma factor (sigma-70 family)
MRVTFGRVVDIGVYMDDLDRRRRVEALFAEHAAAVRAYAARRVPRATADDVVSDVFVVAWRRLEDVPDDGLPWLLGCAQRIIANQRRSVRRQAALRERLSRERTEAPRGHPISDSVLADALATLSKGDREVLMLTAWEGLEPARAAAVMGCSPGAFSMRLHRARRRLAAAMTRADGVRPDPMEAVR